MDLVEEEMNRIKTIVAGEILLFAIVATFVAVALARRRNNRIDKGKRVPEFINTAKIISALSLCVTSATVMSLILVGEGELEFENNESRGELSECEVETLLESFLYTVGPILTLGGVTCCILCFVSADEEEEEEVDEIDHAASL